MLFALEDHHMLKGQISIVGLENLDYYNRFVSLFKCSWDKIDCALMTIGNYGQQERRNKRRYQYASKGMQLAWDELFHMSANDGFENTKRILIELLATNEEFDDSVLDSIVAHYITECENNSTYPWNYYYVKYPVFRPGSYGKFSNSEAAEKPYMFSILQTRSAWSQNTYMPYLKAVDDAHLSRDSMGQRLEYPNVHVTCENAAYVFSTIGDEATIEKVEIQQNAEGIDTEDRIILLKNTLLSKGLM